MEEAPRSAMDELSHPDVGKGGKFERVHEIECLQAGQIALNDTVRQRAMLSPLHADRCPALVAPVRVENRAMPVRPQVGWRSSRRVVADPNLFLVARLGPRQPLAVDIPF